MAHKEYVDVRAQFSKDGTITPVEITWRDGRVFAIDRVSDVRRAASLKAGGVGLRYTCLIQNTSTYLFCEDVGAIRWFVEAKD